MRLDACRLIHTSQVTGLVKISNTYDFHTMNLNFCMLRKAQVKAMDLFGTREMVRRYQLVIIARRLA